MCKVASDAALGQLPALLTPPAQPSEEEGGPAPASDTPTKPRSQDVVMVVGSAHLEGRVHFFLRLGL
jgi:hypothetical protein